MCFLVPEEARKSSQFAMRHTASCVFSHVDADVVSNFGFLPQDMLGRSVFDFYHPEDLPFLREVYESGAYIKILIDFIAHVEECQFFVCNILIEFVTVQ